MTKRKLIIMARLTAIIKKNEETCSLKDHKRCGRHEKFVDVIWVVEQDAYRQSTASVYGECSVRAISRRSEMSYGSLSLSLMFLLRKYPYEMQFVKKLNSLF